MDQVILDLGFNKNVILKQTWQEMEEPKLQWSTIQLRMANQQNIIPMGRVSGVIVDIEEVKALADSEVIHIVDNTDPYGVLLGLDWAIDMEIIINIKCKSMVFETVETSLQSCWIWQKEKDIQKWCVQKRTLIISTK